jgi:hypothetical protein
MGCGASAPAPAPPATPRADADETLSRILAGNQLAEPTRVGTRDTKTDEVHAQRQSAILFLAALSAKRLSKQKTRVALRPQLADQPRSRRISRLGTLARGKLVTDLKTASEGVSPGSRGSASSNIEARLRPLALEMVIMEGDGNCQFRALADQLFGSQIHHKAVRAAAMAHMVAHRDYFSMFFDGPEFARYTKDMQKSRTWGDELTLRAAVEAFGCKAYVITSDEANWYLAYTAETARDEAALGRALGRSLKPPRIGKEVFISYVSPIHYNAIGAVCDESAL